MIASGYAMYGASTMLVFATEDGVDGFTLDTGIGEFILTLPRMAVPNRGKIYSINEGNSDSWAEDTKRYIAHCKGTKDGHKAYSLRYIGASLLFFPFRVQPPPNPQADTKLIPPYIHVAYLSLHVRL